MTALGKILFQQKQNNRCGVIGRLFTSGPEQGSLFYVDVKHVSKRQAGSQFRNAVH